MGILRDSSSSLPTGCSPPTGVACCFRPKTKKPLPDEPEGNIFERELRQLVELQGHAALLPGSGILVKKTLVHSLVYSLDSALVSGAGSLAITFNDSGVELLDIGLEGGLASLVSGIGDLGKLDSLLGGLDVGHGYTSLTRKLCLHGQAHAEMYYTRSCQ